MYCHSHQSSYSRRSSIGATAAVVLIAAVFVGGFSACTPESASASGKPGAAGADAGDAAAACNITDVAVRLAETNAVNCGRSGMLDDQKSVYLCLVSAFKAQNGFYGIFDLPGTDSRIATAFVGRSDGSLTILSYDSCPMGCGDKSHQIARGTCVAPSIESVTGQDVLTCAGVTSIQTECGKFKPNLFYPGVPLATEKRVILKVSNQKTAYPAPPSSAMTQTGG